MGGECGIGSWYLINGPNTILLFAIVVDLIVIASVKLNKSAIGGQL